MSFKETNLPLVSDRTRQSARTTYIPGTFLLPSESSQYLFEHSQSSPNPLSSEMINNSSSVCVVICQSYSSYFECLSPLTMRVSLGQGLKTSTTMQDMTQLSSDLFISLFAIFSVTSGALGPPLQKLYKQNTHGYAYLEVP